MSLPRVVPSELVEHEGRAELVAAPRPKTYVCDHCSRSFIGPPAGSGLLIWTRGDEVRYEEPPLCDDCALSLTTAALMVWSLEGDDE